MPDESSQNPAPINQPSYVNPVGGSSPAAGVPVLPAPVVSTPIAGQPAPYNNYAAQQPAAPQNIKSYRVAAILVTLFCSLPLGIAAIIYSTQVQKYLRAGDTVGAQKASKTAKILIIIGVVIGLPLSVLYIMANIKG